MSPVRGILRRGNVQHPVLISILMLGLSMAVFMVAAVTISVRASERAILESERAQCESVQSDVDAYNAVPPTTKAGIAQLRSKEALLSKWGCPKPDGK